MRGLIMTWTFSILLLSQLRGQDGHYSQFFQAPLYLNPALTGSGLDNLRLGAVYRSQWASLHQPYANYGAYLDIKRKIFGLGLLLNQSQAGEASLKTSNLALNLALHKKLADGQNVLSAGLILGLIQQGFNANSFSFDQQYVPGMGHDPGLSSGENFENTRLLLPDLQLGLNWQFNINRSGPLSGQLGISFGHVNQAKASFYSDNVSYPLKTNIYGLLDFQLSRELFISPKLLFSRQLEAQEMLIGADLVYRLSPFNAFKIGLANRLNDALVFFAGLEMNRVVVGISYDNNLSSFKQTGTRNNAIELTATYRMGPKISKASAKTLTDRDGDGVWDRSDDCPDVPGERSNKGCPEEPEFSKNDFDRDGVNDENDLCPYNFGYPAFQGCSDRDGDGVWDHLDACPTIAGHPNKYGCPADADDLDSDGDGILDREDKCVYIKGLAEFFGCPDSDGDRIADLYDACPYSKGLPALDGCPEEDQKASRNIVLKEVVEFDTDRDEIKDAFVPLLDKIVLEMKFNDNYKIIIEGHTDDEGDKSYNFVLSQKRAAAIQNYIMRYGISSDRITSFYYGETKPKISNESDQAKARNRRTELILVE